MQPETVQLGAKYQNLFQTNSEIVLLEGPSGTGKSTASMLYLFTMADRYPGARILIARKTRASMSETVLKTLETLPHGKWLARTSGGQRAWRQKYIERNDSEYIILGLDNVDRIMSGDYDIIYLCEATECSRQEFENLVTRLRNGVTPIQQIILDYNPSHPLHWINQLKDVETDHGTIKVERIKTNHKDNTVLWDAANARWTERGTKYMAHLEATLTGVRRRRLLLGEWAASEGLVYAEYERCLVMGGKLDVPASRVAVGVDWGWTKPTCFSVGVLDTKDTLHIVDEVYRERMSRENLESEANRIMEKWGAEVFYCDARRPEAIHELRSLGIPVRPNKLQSIESGISLVEQRIISDRLKVWDCCVAMRKEFGFYEYDDHQQPVDANDHAMDSLRYLVAGIDYVKSVPDAMDTEGVQEELRARLGLKDVEAEPELSFIERWEKWRNEVWASDEEFV